MLLPLKLSTSTLNKHVHFETDKLIAEWIRYSNNGVYHCILKSAPHLSAMQCRGFVYLLCIKCWPRTAALQKISFIGTSAEMWHTGPLKGSQAGSQLNMGHLHSKYKQKKREKWTHLAAHPLCSQARWRGRIFFPQNFWCILFRSEQAAREQQCVWGKVLQLLEYFLSNIFSLCLLFPLLSPQPSLLLSHFPTFDLFVFPVFSDPDMARLLFLIILYTLPSPAVPIHNSSAGGNLTVFL